MVSRNYFGKNNVIYMFLAVFLFSGCSTKFKVPIEPPVGLFFTWYKAPLIVNFKEVDTLGKRGEGKTLFIKEPYRGLISTGFGDAGIKSATYKHIRNVKYVDYEYFSIFGYYEEFTIIPHGD